MKKIVLASHNKGKIKEIQELLETLNVEVRSKKDLNILEDVEEPYDSLEQNALNKALYVKSKLENEIVIADDSGLFVDVLNGQPGVRSARYAGEFATDQENRNKLLNELNNEKKRSASFKTCIVILDDKGNRYFANGSIEGSISKIEQGSNGFGYDSIFIPNGYENTFAELDSSIKNQISHRANALKKAKNILKEILDEDSINI